MTIQTKQKLLLPILVFAGFTLQAQDPKTPSINFTIKSTRYIGPWAATPDAIEYLEEQIDKELQTTAQKLCASVDSIPKSETETIFTSVFDVSLRVNGTQSFNCEEEQVSPVDPKP